MTDPELLGLLTVIGKLGSAVKALEAQLAQTNAVIASQSAELEALKQPAASPNGIPEPVKT